LHIQSIFINKTHTLYEIFNIKMRLVNINNKFMNLKITTKIFILLCFIFSLTANAQENKKINEVLAKKIEYNKNNRLGKGYKIQLYNGNESTAYRIKGNFEATYGIVASLSYESPEWKVRVGNYKTRLEADRALLIFKEKFGGAIILETKVYL